MKLFWQDRHYRWGVHVRQLLMTEEQLVQIESMTTAWLLGQVSTQVLINKFLPATHEVQLEPEFRHVLQGG